MVYPSSREAMCLLPSTCSFFSLSRFFCFVGFLTVAYYRSVQWTFDLVLDCFDCFLAMILATDIRLAFIFIWLAKRWKITTFCVEWIWWKSSTAQQHSDMFVCSLFFNLLLSLSFVVVVVLVFYSTNEIKNYLYAILNQDHCFRMQCDALFWPFRRNSLAVVCDALFMWLCLVIRDLPTTVKHMCVVFRNGKRFPHIRPEETANEIMML